VNDPFVSDSAHINPASVVTQEERKPNAAWIPNGCDPFNIDCCPLEILIDGDNGSFELTFLHAA
jgi:hypothetical protein